MSCSLSLSLFLFLFFFFFLFFFTRAHGFYVVSHSLLVRRGVLWTVLLVLCVLYYTLSRLRFLATYWQLITALLVLS